MKKYLNKIIQGDCLEVMKNIPDKSVDMVLTSVPFKEEDVEGNYWEEYDKWFSEMNRVCSKVILIIQSATKLNDVITKYPPKRTMIWGKGVSCYSWRYNPVFVYQMSDDYKVNKYIWNDAFVFQSVLSKEAHKYEDPINLYKTIIGMFKNCDLILDPFAGSGTTAVAAQSLKRNFIGIEISKEYCKIVRQRLRQHPLL